MFKVVIDLINLSALLASYQVYMHYWPMGHMHYWPMGHMHYWPTGHIHYWPTEVTCINQEYLLYVCPRESSTRQQLLQTTLLGHLLNMQKPYPLKD